jgi:E3 ubiquitin-protein ligase UBR4
MALRLPYQTKKISEANLGLVEPTHFESEWYTVLCEYMMTHQTPYVRRQARKLLLYICGTKEKYRELRDLHTLASHMADVRKIVGLEDQAPKEKSVENSTYINSSPPINLAYDTLLRLIEHLNACVEISSSRTINWQKFCSGGGDESMLPFLLRISFLLDDGVSPIVLQLLQNAICPMQSLPILNQPTQSASSSKGSRSVKASSPSKSVSRHRGEKSKSEEPIGTGESLDLLFSPRCLETLLEGLDALTLLDPLLLDALCVG